MDQVREGQIALALLKLLLKKRGLKLKEELKDELQDISHQTEISLHELNEFSWRRTQELTQDIFGFPR